jgi:hypothetical protein
MDRTWHFKVTVDGEDLIGEGITIDDGIATTWDDHSTSSGTPADKEGYLGCSLPTGRCNKTKGSPFPKLPWHTKVRIWNPKSNKQVVCDLIDEGPSYYATAGTGEYGNAMIDLTPAAKFALGAKHANDNFPVRIRIFGGAKYLGGK